MFSMFHKIPNQELPHTSPCQSEPRAPCRENKSRERALPIRSILKRTRKRRMTEAQKVIPKDENDIPIHDTDDTKIHSLDWPRQTAYSRNKSRDKWWHHGTCAGFGGHMASQQEWPWYGSYPSTRFKLLTILRKDSINAVTMLSIWCLPSREKVLGSGTSTG